MRLLLDTHAFLWYVLNDPKLSTVARQAISDPANEALLSTASYWEIAIKVGLGKYRIPQPLEQFITDEIAVNDFEILPIELRHAALLTSLPHHHRDPFDRMLAAQAIVEQIPLVSADTAFDPYPLTRLW